MTEPDALRAYIVTVDRLSGAPAKDDAACAAMVVTLAPMWALGEALGPWPEQTPAGPLDSLKSAP